MAAPPGTRLTSPILPSPPTERERPEIEGLLLLVVVGDVVVDRRQCFSSLIIIASKSLFIVSAFDVSANIAISQVQVMVTLPRARSTLPT